MTRHAESWLRSVAAAIRRVRTAYGSALLLIATAIMVVMSALMLTHLFAILISKPSGAIDLKYYYSWVQLWFHGQPVYALPERPEYPPASMAILWPLVGWLSPDHARLLWAATDAVALVALAMGIVRATGATGLVPRAFVVLMLLSMTPTGAAVGNGQLILHVLPILLIGVFILRNGRPGWPRDVIATPLLLVTLVKPTISVPFLWVALLARGSVRPILLVVAGYIALTLFAASFQQPSLWHLLTTSVANGWRQATMAYDGNLHFLLRLLGLQRWILPASALALGALGLWTYRNRKHDVWLLLAVAALVARLWTYHRIYDGVLVVMAEIALFRIASRRFYTDDFAAAAAALLAANVLVFLSPGPGGPLPRVGDLALQAGQALVTGVDLMFLVYYAHRRSASWTEPHVFE